MAVSSVDVAGATAHEVSLKKFGGPVRPVSQVASVGVTQGRILQNNPRRVAILLVNRSAFDITCDFTQPVVLGSGFLIAANGGSVEMDVNDDGEVVAWEMFAISGGAASPLYILEIMRV